MADDLTESLALSKADFVASAARSALGAVPFAGSLLAEIAGTVIPNQRIDRIVRFASELENRIADIERKKVRMHLTDENFTDLVEEALRQAARSTTDERREHIASVVSTSLTDEHVSFESKHLLRLLGEINDIEVVWLRAFLHPAHRGDEQFRSKHDKVLAPRVATMGSSQSDVDHETLQRSYKEHLRQLGLLDPRYLVDRKTGLPEFEQDGRMKTQGYELSRFGRLLLRHLGFEDPYTRSRSPKDV